MEFFERAHVSRKDSSKKDSKSEEAVKKQLKQMLNAYKKGNNQEIKTFADDEQRYDIDDIKSVSEYSDVSFLREANISHEKITSHGTGNVQSITSVNSISDIDNISSKSAMSLSDEDSLESMSQFEEEVKSLSLSDEISASDKELTSTFDSSLISEDNSNDSDISIPSSLQTSTGSDNDLSDEGEFDPDGTLATIILEKLGKGQLHNNKRKLTKEETGSDKKPKKEKVKKEKKEQSSKNVLNIVKKVKKKVIKNEFTEGESYRVLETDFGDSTYRDVRTEFSEDSFQGDTEDSLSSDLSTPFISVSATNMESQSLNEIIGDYVHPTVRNLPSEKQNIIVRSHSSKYDILDEMVNMDNSDEVSSLIPEIDEDLAIEDLTLETEHLQHDDSTVYDDTVQTEDYFEHDLTDVDDTFVPIQVFKARNNYILVMKHPAELFVQGKVKVEAIGGLVEVFGYTLQDEVINLFAPYCHFAQCIKTISNPSSFNGLFSKLTASGVTGSEAEEIITTVSEYDAVICLSKLNSPKIDFVDNNFTAAELFSRRIDYTPKFLKKVAENLGCSLYVDDPKRIFEEKSSWDQVVSCGMENQSKGIICGGKGTGKSTFLRYYANRLLGNGPVLVIDLDPGQAEFTIAGSISVTVVDTPLIGPNFTHLRKPEKTLNIGMINTMDNPSRYIAAVQELVTYCQTTGAYHSMPWIVNTMGMCNHMGLKFITYIIQSIRPTFVYQIDSKAGKKKFEFDLESHKIQDIYEEYKQDPLFSKIAYPYSLDYIFIKGVIEDKASPQKGSNNFSLSPKDERYLNVLAYFGELLDIHRKSILEIVPYEVNIRDLSIGFNVKIPEAAFTKVINGKIIALCQLTAADKGKVFTLGDNAILSHGYGLIRGVDFGKGLLYILTPVPLEQLSLVNTLVYADWMPELQGQEKELPSGTTIPFRTATLSHQRKLMFPPRRRFNPIQLLKVTRST